ncbi:MAG: MFS transporter [Gammaproteobacteria bacterium]|nr:MFS transporter [Gammaproteobacteria bacterium]
MQTGASAESPDLAQHPYRWLMLAGVWLLYFCFGLSMAALAPLVQPITHELDISHVVMGGVFGSWPLVYIASALPCGALLDRIGVRHGLFIGAVIIALSGILRSFAGDAVGLFAAGALFGVGGPLISVGAPKAISLWFTGKSRGLAMGIYITGPNLGSIVALSLTNSVFMPATDGDWRTVLLGYGLFTLVSAGVWLAISAHRAGRGIERQVDGAPPRSQLLVFADLIRLRAVRIVLLMSIGIFFFNHALNNWLPEILRVAGMDVVRAGLWASIPTAVGIVASLIIPRLAIPSRRLAILLGLFVCAAGATVLLQSTSEPGLMLGLIVQGVARSTMITLAILVLVEIPEVGPTKAGLASGLFFSAAEVGGVLGPLTMGFITDLSGGFDVGLQMLTGVCAVLALLVVGLWRHERQHLRADER